MAKQHGKGSSVTFANLTVGDHEFTVTDTADTAEVTDFTDGAAGFKKWLAGLRDWNGEISFHPTAETHQNGIDGHAGIYDDPGDLDVGEKNLPDEPKGVRNGVPQMQRMNPFSGTRVTTA